MRQIQDEQQPLDAHLQQQNGPGSHDEHADFLRPPTPSPSQATTSPGSPSCASTTHSLTRDLDDVDIGADEPRNKKRKAGRSGPLTPLDRAKAAFKRKLGACQECRLRKVTCIHFDNTLFEKAYQASKQAPKVSQLLGSPIQLQQQPAVPYRRHFSDPAVNLGIGSWHNLPDTHNDGFELGNFMDDIGDQQSLPAADAPAPLYNFPPRPLFGATDLAQNPFQNGSTVSENSDLAIGRLVDGLDWECRFGDNITDASTSISQVAPCNWRFGSLEQLKVHYEQNHTSFQGSYSMWKCTAIRQNDTSINICGFLNSRPLLPCLICSGTQLEEWHFGSASRIPSLTTGPSVRVGSQDGSPKTNNPWFPRAYPSLPQGQFDFSMLYPGYRGNRSASCRSVKALPTNEMRGRPKTASTSKCFRRVDVYPGGCPYGRKCSRTMSWPWDQMSKGGTLGSTLATCSVLLVLSVVSLVCFQDWISTNASLANSKAMTSVFLETGQKHTAEVAIVFLLAGLAGMWLFKHVRLRVGRGFEPSACHQRCLIRDLFGIPPRLDLEDAGSVLRPAEVVGIS